jgi:hypothetical protein
MNTTTAYRAAKTLTAIYLLTALSLSFTHIAELFGLLGSDWQRWIAPVMIDMVAVIGKISMGPQFTAKTRKIGNRALWIAGSISFTANVTVGVVEGKAGDAILGAIVVFGALWAEGHLHNLRPVTKRAPRTAKAPARKRPAAQTRKPLTVVA